MNQPLDRPAAPAADTTTRAAALIEAVEAAYSVPTSYRNDEPLPAVGTTPPVVQPGRPPMSQRATDASAVILATGAASLPVGAAAALVLWASGGADPVVTAMFCGAPTALILAVGRLVKRAKASEPPVHHHHYGGPVHQDHSQVTTTTRGVIARTTNNDARR
ncbi:hypothetical protein [Streptomyces sp. NPDC050355]|uniref:hypothetical protein n=1 Tax=Streptomyces sp. NPDC050355 TaxID=3365609 RepID=UPI0037A354C1